MTDVAVDMVLLSTAVPATDPGNGLQDAATQFASNEDGTGPMPAQEVVDPVTCHEITTVNPLYNLSQRMVLEGEPIHVYKVQPGEVIIRAGVPTTLVNGILHPLTWTVASSPSNLGAEHAHSSGASGTDAGELKSLGESAIVRDPLGQQNLEPLRHRKLGTQESPPARHPRTGRSASPQSFRTSLPPPQTPPKPTRSLSTSSSLVPTVSRSPETQRKLDLSLSKPLPIIAANDLPVPTLSASPTPLSSSPSTVLTPPSPPALHRSPSATSSASTARYSTRGGLGLGRAQSHERGSPVPSQPIRSLAVTPLVPIAVPVAGLDLQDIGDEDVETLIARQATLIRTTRAQKRLQAEKELLRQEQLNGTSLPGEAMARTTSVSRAGGPNHFKRRSVRANSNGESIALGAGVLVGNLIDQNHANYVLMYNMLTGIRIAVSEIRLQLASLPNSFQCSGIEMSSQDQAPLDRRGLYCEAQVFV